MESIKIAIRESVSARYGSCFVEIHFDPDPCFAVCIKKYNYHVLYFRPDDRKVVCYYAHAGDLQACGDISREVQCWKQQEIYQLVRQYPVSGKQLVPRILGYVDDAVARMQTRELIDDRGGYKRVKTFEEAKLEAYLYPKPKRPAKIIPPPICRRHNDVHWEAEKKKKKNQPKAPRKPRPLPPDARNEPAAKKP